MFQLLGFYYKHSFLRGLLRGVRCLGFRADQGFGLGFRALGV